MATDIATRCNTYCNTLQQILQHAATDIATRCNTENYSRAVWKRRSANTIQYNAAASHCNTRQSYVALRLTATHRNTQATSKRRSAPSTTRVVPRISKTLLRSIRCATHYHTASRTLPHGGIYMYIYLDAPRGWKTLPGAIRCETHYTTRHHALDHVAEHIIACI